MATLTRAERGALEKEGALIQPIGLGPVPLRKYYNRHGEERLMRYDPWHLEYYLTHGFSLTPPETPAPAPMRIGAAEPTAGEMARMNGQEEALAVVPTATYYTADGTEVPGLPADPDSMARYLEMGLSLSLPSTAPPAARRGSGQAKNKEHADGQ